mmetsp:Transcript_119909/g.344534  ORF Transcript_119909/g.344534 Transcript_119909/m.344534 type:complete len:283 (+) Transcript_119909:1441-2289(+)
MKRRVVDAEDACVRRQESAQVQVEDGWERFFLGKITGCAQHNQRVVVFLVDTQLYDGYIAVFEDIVQGRSWRRLDRFDLRCLRVHHHHPVSVHHDTRGLDRPPRSLRFPLTESFFVEGLLHSGPGLLGALSQEQHDVLGLTDNSQVNTDPLLHLKNCRSCAKHAEGLARSFCPTFGDRLVPLRKHTSNMQILAEAQGDQVRPMLLVKQGLEALLVRCCASLHRAQGSVGIHQVPLGKARTVLHKWPHERIIYQACIAVLFLLNAVSLINEKDMHTLPIDIPP